jgi:hypothetical protein
LVLSTAHTHDHAGGEEIIARSAAAILIANVTPLRRRFVTFTQPSNHYDPNAILVRLSGFEIGYVPRLLTGEIDVEREYFNLKTFTKHGKDGRFYQATIVRESW